MPESFGSGLRVSVRQPNLPRAYQGFLNHFIPSEACILLLERFPIETPLQVEFNGFQFEGTVAFCKRKHGVFELHILINDFDGKGRRDPRYVVNLQARFYTSFTERPVDALLVDISREGLGVNCAVQPEVGGTVAVESQANLAFGCVRYCRPVSPALFRVGILVYNVVTKERQGGPQRDKSWFEALLSRPSLR